MHNRYEIQREDCPGCGAKEGAFMGSSEWGHSIVCCSDKCGHKITKLIDKNIRKKQYKKKLQEYYDLDSDLKEMRLDGIDCDYEPFFNL